MTPRSLRRVGWGSGTATGRALHLLALCALAVAQPLLDLLGRNAVLLVAQRITPADLVLLLFVLLLGLPALFWLAVETVSRASPRLARALYAIVIAVAVAATALPPVKRVVETPALVPLALAITVGIAGAFAYFRLEAARRFVTVLALGPLLFAGAFVTNESISKLLFPPEWHAGTSGSGGVSVVMVVFDELPTTSLLDEKGRIDPLRFPAFARLAHDATWFRNASAVHSLTEYAVPPILTGRYPRLGQLPTAADHPHNLFTLFARHHALHVVEALTALFDPPGDAPEPTRASHEGCFSRLASLLSDLQVVYLHVLLPEEFARGLPPVTQTWGGFGRNASWDPGRYRGRAFADRVEVFRRFVGSISAAQPGDRPTLHFLHCLLPHAPYQYLPSGRAYFPPTDYDFEDNMWGEEEWWVIQGYQRHLLQLGLADALLGTLLERLKETGRYDETLVVVTADHGAGFWAGESRRDPGRMQHPEELLAVPLLIKAPGQREGRSSLRNVETIDILPTVADLAGIELPWPTDGCSAFDADCSERATKTLYDWRGRPRSFDADVVGRRASLERRLALFGSGSRADGLYAVGRFGALVGRPLAELVVREAVGPRVVLMQQPFELASRRPSEFSTARLTGALRSGAACGTSPHLAFAAGGTIRAVAPAFAQPHGDFFFSVVVPEHAAPCTAREIEIFCVTGSPDVPELHSARVSLGRFRHVAR